MQDIKLPKTLIAEPPLELWPEVVARIAVPEDVAEKVIRPLLLLCNPSSVTSNR